GIFWLRMGGESVEGDQAGIAVQVASCGGPGGLDLPGWAALDFNARVAAVYAAWQEPTARLLVLEDLQDVTLLARWCPQGGGCRVLITTTAWPSAQFGRALKVAPLPRPASLQLLLGARAATLGSTFAALLGDGITAQIANAVCDELSDLPLALSLAAAALMAT